MSRTERQLSGQSGEAQAERLLGSSGLQLVERNYRCRAGEIDLVMIDPATAEGDVLVFVEVRKRAPGAMVEAIETIDRNKQRKLIQAARHFLMAHPIFSSSPCRFDVIAIDDPDEKARWVRNAFESSG
ncbi:MAG: YraN family protein [Wenzhouxiangella sp.]|jgi:putative endonuclease|nr:YraN family protein [Wenzhouxiangella sp.]